ncbi:uncharacterized protein CMU_018710 [Cryptosporidium muris RN66]|uniref:Uncharacterized protein n=1 Tax=Cryptosporidium muris (strain RN66) TaxID=441375 RepID=B6ADB0_CRYMR|nr:uncharacterized protein CMU_018710 [Cryptosporidium muris RN66]EEA06114.1 hypothetical protein, conserved [Cryptosporidium muris RN66]|eukprot:XP_002140463.1 hypothetical protein [Cryptosporidium muris RN66]
MECNSPDSNFCQSLPPNIKQYKLINRNQLMRVNMPLLKMKSYNFDVGTVIEEDSESELQSKIQKITKKQRILKFMENVKMSIKTNYENLKLGIHKIFRKSSNKDKILNLSNVDPIILQRPRKKRKFKYISGQFRSDLNAHFQESLSLIRLNCIRIKEKICTKITLEVSKISYLIHNTFNKKKSSFIISFKSKSKLINISDCVENKEDLSSLICENNTTKQYINEVKSENKNNNELKDNIYENSSNFIVLTELSDFVTKSEPDTTPSTIDSFPYLNFVDSMNTTQNDSIGNHKVILLNIQQLLLRMESMYKEISCKDLEDIKRNLDRYDISIKFIDNTQIDNNCIGETNKEDIINYIIKQVLYCQDILDSTREMAKLLSHKYFDLEKDGTYYELAFLIVSQSLQYYEKIQRNLNLIFENRMIELQPDLNYNILDSINKFKNNLTAKLTFI